MAEILCNKNLPFLLTFMFNIFKINELYIYICCQSNLYYIIYLFILKYVNMLLLYKIIGPKEDYFNIITNKYKYVTYKVYPACCM